MSSPRRGRRPGAPDTRAAILDAARAQFAALGFSSTTIRAIATEAGVDAALVHHYFGSKDDLFMAAMQLPVDPREVLVPALAGDPDGAGERMLGVFLDVWDDPELQPALLAFARRVLEPDGGRLLGQGFLPVVLQPIGRELGVDEPDRRMPLVASQVIGVVLLRYVLGVEPLASMPREELVATYGPTLQRYLTGPLP